MQRTVLAGSARKKESAPLFTKTPLNSNIKTSVNPYRPLNSKKFPPFSSSSKTHKIALFQHVLSLFSYSQSMLGSRNPLPSFSNITLMPTIIILVVPMQMDDKIEFKLISCNKKNDKIFEKLVVSAYESSKNMIFEQYFDNMEGAEQ